MKKNVIIHMSSMDSIFWNTAALLAADVFHFLIGIFDKGM